MASIDPILARVRARFDPDLHERVIAAVKKLWNGTPQLRMTDCGNESSEESEVEALLRSRRFFFEPSASDLARHVEFLKIPNLADDDNDVETAFEKVEKKTRRRLVHTLAVAYHCFSDSHVIHFVRQGGFHSLVDLLAIKPLVFRFWAIEIITRAMKMGFWNMENLQKSDPRSVASVKEMSLHKRFLRHLHLNIGGEFSGPCLQILAFTLAFNQRYHPSALAQNLDDVRKILHTWTENAEEEEEKKLARSILDAVRRARAKDKDGMQRIDEPEISEAEAQKRKGNESFRKKDFDQAIKHYTNAIELDGKVSGYFSNRANAIMQKAQQFTSDKKHYKLLLHEVIIDCDRALKQDPSYQKAIRRKGLALYELGQHKEAVVCFNQLKKVDSKISKIKASVTRKT